MKKLSKLLALSAGIAALFFIGCSNISNSDDDSSNATVASGVTDKTAAATLKDYTIQFVTEEGIPLDLSKYVNSSSSRTIVGDALDLTSDVEFYLWGTNAYDATDTRYSTPKKVTFTVDSTDATKGTVALDLSASKWNLVLAATKKQTGGSSFADADAAKDDAYYIGYANVDLREANSIKFYLSADGLKGKGSVDVKVKADTTWSDAHKTLFTATDTTYQIVASITSRKDGHYVGNATSSSGDATGKAIAVTNATSAADAFFGANGAAYSEPSLDPGTYNFEVRFINSVGSKTYIWSDLIIILPNQEISKTIEVPDIVEYAPDAPATLKVGYIEPETDIDSYDALITWTDTINNEKYFQLEVLDVPYAATETISAVVDDDTKWQTAVNAAGTANLTKYKEDFYGNTEAGWVAGSLQKNNKNVVIKLALGKRYLMRLAAVNDAGTSAYCYATYDLDTAWTSAEGKHGKTATWTPKAYTMQEIDTTTNKYKAGTTIAFCASLYRLTYHLNGGKYYFAAGAGTTPDTSTDDLVYYLSQNPAGIDIYTPCKNALASTPAYPSLISGTNRWTSWRVGIIEGPKYGGTFDPEAADSDGYSYYKPPKYKDFANLHLYASYAVSSAQVQVYQDAVYEFIAAEISLSNPATPVTGATDNYEFDTKSATNEITITFTKDSTRQAAFTKYDTLRTEIKKTGSTNVIAAGNFSSGDNGATYKFTAAQFTEGKYEIKVIGEYKGHQYSYPIILTVVNTATD